MKKHFTFGHTLQPIDIQNSSEEDLEQLFKIGGDHIRLPKQPHSPSDNTPPDPHKHKQLAKKHHKGKRKTNREPQLNSEDRKKGQTRETPLIVSSSSEDGRQLVLFEDKKKPKKSELMVEALTGIQRQLSLQSGFEVGRKLGGNLLKVDIYSAPEKQLYHHGLMDQEVPEYSRLQCFQSIIGGKMRHPQLIAKHLAQKIHQRRVGLDPEQVSRSRYFGFHGYDSLPEVRLTSPQTEAQHTWLIPLSATPTASQPTEQQQLLNANRDFNTKLHRNPGDIDLWLQFVDFQRRQECLRHHGMNRTGIIDRQLSILEKAIEANPRDLRLGMAQLELLMQKGSDGALVSQKCRNLIETHPEQPILWKKYLEIKASQFNLFSHQLTRQIFEQLVQAVRGFIDNTRSAVQVWKIRKSGLELVKNMALLYKLQGYGELATGLLVALVDYNFCLPQSLAALTPQQRMAAFTQYWESQTAYRLGELPTMTGWRNHLDTTIRSQTEVDSSKFIGSFCKENKPSGKNSWQRELQKQDQAWRPSHPRHDKDTIKQRSDSYILIEDIDYALHLYRDTESLLKLLDVLADHLELPEVFSFKGYRSQFGVCLVRKNLFGGGSFGEEFYWWRRFWNPFASVKNLQGSRVAKLQYFRRILQGVRLQLSSHQQSIFQYLMFINCCYYACPELQRCLGLTEAEVLAAIQNLLAENDSLYVSTWSIYIWTTHRLKRNTQDCIDCYLQLIQANLQNSQRRGETQLIILFELWEFLSCHQSSARGRFLSLYLRLLDGACLGVDLRLDLTESEEQRLSRYLCEKLDVGMKQDVQRMKDCHLLCIILLDCLKQGYFKNLQHRRPMLIATLIEWMVKAHDSVTQHFLLYQLTERQLITPSDIQVHGLLVSLPYFELVQHWLNLHPQPLCALLAQFQSIHHKNLSLWMICSMYLLRKNTVREEFEDQLIAVGKKLCYEGQVGQLQSQYVVLLNAWAAIRARERHIDFIQYSLRLVPFAKELFVQLVMASRDEQQRGKIISLMQEKGIRLLSSELASP